MPIELSPTETAGLAITGFAAMQKPAELSALLGIVDSLKPKVILEVGVGKGGTSWCWSKLNSVELIIAIDLIGGPWGGGPTKESLEYIASHTKASYVFMDGNSQSSKTLMSVEKILDEREVDFLFIDGDHSYAGVKTDFLIYKRFVRSGGVIAFHDICEHAPETKCEVKKFWDEIKETCPVDKYSELIQEPTTWGGIGIVKI